MELKIYRSGMVCALNMCVGVFVCALEKMLLLFVHPCACIFVGMHLCICINTHTHRNRGRGLKSAGG